MTKNTPIPINKKVKTVCIVIFKDALSIDIMGPLEVFAIADRMLKEEQSRSDAGYKIEIVSHKKGPVTLSSGAQIIANQSFESFKDENIDTLIVSGGAGALAASKDQILVNWIKSKAPKVRRLTCIGNGSLILGKAGLLDGRNTTTHWKYKEDLAKVSQDIFIDDKAIYKRDENIYTSAGVTSGMDLALSMVEEDLGNRIPLQVAKCLVLFVKRPGNQSQFSDILSHQLKADKFSHLINWINNNVAENLSVEKLAEKAVMSTRSFARKFTDEIGITPAKFVEIIRLEKALTTLENSQQSIEAIAFDCGFKSPDQFRRAFERRFNTSPIKYRQQHNSQN